MYKKIVISRTPLRVSFLGGGTDMSNFYKKYSGLVVSATINKFIYVTVKEHGELFFKNFRLNYSKTENKNKLNEIHNDIIRETLKVIKIKKPLYISSISDIPANMGLGSSSAFTVGLIKALYQFKNIKISNIEIAKLACKIEINKVKSPIGKQDQYATAIGGLNVLRFNKNSKVSIKKFKDAKIVKKIFENSLFIWSGKARKTNSILLHQNKRFSSNKKNLINIKNLANNFIVKLKNKKFSIEEFANLVDASWQFKKKLSKKINSSRIQKIYYEAMRNGSLGGKLLGAGGGGFLFLIVKKNNIEKFIKKMNISNKELQIMKFQYNELGSEILLNL
jgi:D-glycero-alpha-D-manno-heptose-7-phosphate kinase